MLIFETLNPFLFAKWFMCFRFCGSCFIWICVRVLYSIKFSFLFIESYQGGTRRDTEGEMGEKSSEKGLKWKATISETWKTTWVSKFRSWSVKKWTEIGGGGGGHKGVEEKYG